MIRVVTFWTDARYKAMADRMIASAKAVGLETVGYEMANPTGAWVTGMNLKPSVVLQATRDYPGDSILFIDADCWVQSYPEMLREETHDCHMACTFDGATIPKSPVLWLRGSTAAFYAAAWVSEMAKNPGKLDDDVCLWTVIQTVKPRPRVLHLPPAYAWVPEWHRNRFGNVTPVIRHLAVGEHKTINLIWPKTAATIF